VCEGGSLNIEGGIGRVFGMWAVIDYVSRATEASRLLALEKPPDFRDFAEDCACNLLGATPDACLVFFYS
jgi:hypothetical protein